MHAHIGQTPRPVDESIQTESESESDSNAESFTGTQSPDIAEDVPDSHPGHLSRLSEYHDDQRGWSRPRDVGNSARIDESDSSVKPVSWECPECHGPIREQSARGERSCEDCGLVVSHEQIDAAKQRALSEDGRFSDKKRTGQSLTNRLHDNGLSTSISSADRDGNGNILSSNRRATMSRLRTWNRRFKANTSAERSLRLGLGEIERMASQLTLPGSVRERASVIYRRAVNNDLLPGRSIEGVATAALYIAARQAGCPRPLSEVTELSRVERDRISNTFRYVCSELTILLSPEDPASFVPRVAAALDASPAVRTLVMDILDDVRGSGVFAGKEPISMTAGAFDIARLHHDADFAQQDIAAASYVTTVTARTRRADLLEAADCDYDV